MKIIKRNGAEVPFDITKIITAVTKASDSVGGQARLSREQITQIAAAVTDQCQQLNRAVSVEEVQDLVENQLMDIQAHDVARHYITYRYVQSLKRQTNTTDERILSLIECQNEEVKQENANKNPTVNSVQRDYMAGEISKDLTARLLLDPEIVKAHQEGLIHFHDSDYFAQHMHNCDLVNLEDMLQNGTVISTSTSAAIFLRETSTKGARWVRLRLWPPYWLEATCAMIWVAMLQAVEKLCGFSI